MNSKREKYIVTEPMRNDSTTDTKMAEIMTRALPPLINMSMLLTVRLLSL